MGIGRHRFAKTRQHWSGSAGSRAIRSPVDCPARTALPHQVVTINDCIHVAFIVDLAVVGMLFWVVSGIWMWWEIKPARSAGAVFGLLGCGAFGLLLATI